MQADPDLKDRVKTTTAQIFENMHIVANEPSLALYRLQEHVRKALVPMVESRVDACKLYDELQGRCFDVEYAITALKTIDNADACFARIHDALKRAIVVRQQLKYEEMRTRRTDSSVYKRLSAHLTLDLPELGIELSDVVRETASKVENMMQQARA